MNTKNIIVTRTFDAPIEEVWKAWVESEMVRKWWGPDHFISPSAQMDVREDCTSIVCMRAPKDFGGMDYYNTWKYTKVKPMVSLEYVQNLSDKDGNRIDPTSVGMPDNFPEDTKTIATFKDLGNEKTEVTITEYNMPGVDTEMGRRAEMGLEQCMDKMGAIWKS